jgi:hypothetical protein
MSCAAQKFYCSACSKQSELRYYFKTCGHKVCPECLEKGTVTHQNCPHLGSCDCSWSVWDQRCTACGCSGSPVEICGGSLPEKPEQPKEKDKCRFCGKKSNNMKKHMIETHFVEYLDSFRSDESSPQ